MFHHNHISLAIFELFLQEVQAQKAAKTAQKVQVNYGYGGESMAGNSNREIFLNCGPLNVLGAIHSFLALQTNKKISCCPDKFTTSDIYLPGVGFWD